jgi:hypothetical protein
MHGSAATRLLGLWHRISPGAWMSLCCECCVLLGKGVLRADHSSRGVLPSVECLSVIVKPGQREGPGLIEAVVSWKEKYRNFVLKLNRYQRNPTMRFVEHKSCFLNGKFRFQIWPVTRLSWQAFGHSSLFLQIYQVAGSRTVPIHAMKAYRGVEV